MVGIIPLGSVYGINVDDYALYGGRLPHVRSHVHLCVRYNPNPSSKDGPKSIPNLFNLSLSSTYDVSPV